MMLAIEVSPRNRMIKSHRYSQCVESEVWRRVALGNR